MIHTELKIDATNKNYKLGCIKITFKQTTNE